MTNYTLNIPEVDIQKKTIESFYKIFKIPIKLETIIFCDEKPLSKIKGKITLYNGKKYDNYKVPGLEYENNLKKIEQLKDAILIKTNGLCDGYIKAIELCKTKYLFFLEHDWLFLNNIEHTLENLISIMDTNIYINNILFNKKKNINDRNQKIYINKENIPLLLTNRQSNNPNILRIEHANKIRIKLINSKGCSIHSGIEYYYNINNMKIPNYCGGIECELCKYCENNIDKIKELGTYLYGKINMNPTITHIDGCNRKYLSNYT